MEPRLGNPFIVGDWIKEDKDFIGRTSLINYFLSLQRQHNWLIGSRRMGKTSLLRYLQRRFRENSRMLPIFWDVSAIRSAEDVLESLQDTLEGLQPDLVARNILFTSEQPHADVFSLLRALARACSDRQVILMLLIDEAEALFGLFARERDVLSKMKALLDNEQIHVIMASNHGLETFDPLNTEHLLSPFLQGFAPPQFLQAWTREEALQLIGRCTGIAEEQDQIITTTGGLPYLVQMVCFHYHESHSLGVAVQTIKERHFLDLFFRHDLHCLGDANSRMLAYLGRQQPVSIAMLESLHHHAPTWLQRMTLLQQLDFIRMDALGNICISNEFLSDWLKLAFPCTSGALRGMPANMQHRLWLCLNKDAVRVDWNDQTIYIGRLSRAESGLKRSEAIDKAGHVLFQEIFSIPELLPVRERLSSAHDFFQIYVENVRGEDLLLECLHDGNHFLGLRHAITRVREGGKLLSEAPSRTSWRILLIAADTPPAIPRVDQEIVLIRERLKAAAQDRNIDLAVDCLFSHQSDMETVQHAVTTGRYDVIHYAGHAMAADGSTDHQLFFRQQRQDRQAVRAIWVSDWLQQAATPVHLLYINGCGDSRMRVSNRYPEHVRFYLYNRTRAMDEFSAHFAIELYRLLPDAGFDPVNALPLARKGWYDRHGNDPAVQDFWRLPVLYRLQ